MKSQTVFKNVIEMFPSGLNLTESRNWKSPLSKLRELTSRQKIRLSLLLFLHLCIVLLFIFLLTLVMTMPVFADSHVDTLNISALHSYVQ